MPTVAGIDSRPMPAPTCPRCGGAPTCDRCASSCEREILVIDSRAPFVLTTVRVAASRVRLARGAEAATSRTGERQRAGGSATVTPSDDVDTFYLEHRACGEIVRSGARPDERARTHHA